MQKALILLVLCSCANQSEYCWSAMNDKNEWKDFCYLNRLDCDSDQKGMSKMLHISPNPNFLIITSCMEK